MDIALPFSEKNSEDECKKVGLHAAFQVAAPKISPLQEIPLVFGRKWYDHFSLIQSRLKEEYGEQLEDLALLAHMLLIFGSTASAKYISLHYSSNPDVSPTVKKLSTPDGYLDYEGAAAVLDGQLAKIDQPTMLLNKTSFETMPKAAHILEVSAVRWFIEAADLYKSDRRRALDVLYDAVRASEEAFGLHMWDCSEESAKEAGPSSSSAASAMAKQRHKENYALAEVAIQYWKENIDKNLSASKAADYLLRVVPLSHKKLAELVSAAKKKLP